MAKYRVIKGFTDKYDEKIKYKVNDELDFTDKRAEEILSVGKLIEKIEKIEEIEEKEQIQEEKPLENAENDEKIEEKPRKRGKK